MVAHATLFCSELKSMLREASAKLEAWTEEQAAKSTKAAKGKVRRFPKAANG